MADSLVELNRWLAPLVERRGSDLLLVTDAPACIRVDGEVVAIGNRPLHSDEIENAITPALMPHALRQYLETHIADPLIWKAFCASAPEGEMAPKSRCSISDSPSHPRTFSIDHFVPFAALNHWL